uniref:Secreted protein n=1 Tax=Setaria digitata TaxID=48799 RepID=A0A915PV81_9BILA
MILLFITLLISVSAEINKTDASTTIGKETFDGTDPSDIEEHDNTSDQDYHEMEDSHTDNSETDDQREIISIDVHHSSDDSSKSHPPAFGPPTNGTSKAL